MEYQSTVVDDLVDVPLPLIGAFCRAGKDKQLSKQQQYDLVEEAALEYIIDHNADLTKKKDSGSFIVQDDDFVTKMIKAYEKFIGKMSGRYPKI
ncbi:hypothetical protein KY312_02900 [Candidatus Woesearchaeota archaeon]|nr:hypothetical protein [Candidatus Woesearchaeota archaeon]